MGNLQFNTTRTESGIVWTLTTLDGQYVGMGTEYTYGMAHLAAKLHAESLRVQGFIK